MEISILFFGELVEVAGANKIAVQNMSDTQSLTEWMVEKYPALKNRTYRVAVNKEVISEKRNLNNGDEIAFLPPYAGG
ncbi:MAG TPA: MoaD/ThiS family protein [Bacteroidia bacterium]|jgi:molybdopterin synthase sulfur carrier subunit|nr:MoaD/ThiS family protein [Bacteroidia bacterium]